QARHFDVRNDQIRLRALADLHQLAAVSGDADHFVAKQGKRLFQILAHDGLIVRHCDAQATIHDNAPEKREVAAAAYRAARANRSAWRLFGRSKSSALESIRR